MGWFNLGQPVPSLPCLPHNVYCGSQQTNFIVFQNDTTDETVSSANISNYIFRPTLPDIVPEVGRVRMDLSQKAQR